MALQSDESPTKRLRLVRSANVGYTSSVLTEPEHGFNQQQIRLHASLQFTCSRGENEIRTLGRPLCPLSKAKTLMASVASSQTVRAGSASVISPGVRARNGESGKSALRSRVCASWRGLKLRCGANELAFRCAFLFCIAVEDPPNGQ
jgi:hypothetical protein